MLGGLLVIALGLAPLLALAVIANLAALQRTFVYQIDRFLARLGALATPANFA